MILGRLVLLVLALMAAADAARAHGGIDMEKDPCKLRVGPYLMHFTGYRPVRGYSEEFCGDIPSAGPTIIVLDFVDDALRDLPTEVRIVRAGGDGDLEGATAFRLPPQVYATGSLSFDYTFADAGDYVALVTVTDGEQKLLARFPLAVGSSKWLRKAVTALVLVLGVAGAYAYWARLRTGPARV